MLEQALDELSPKALKLKSPQAWRSNICIDIHIERPNGLGAGLFRVFERPNGPEATLCGVFAGLYGVFERANGSGAGLCNVLQCQHGS